MPDARGGAVSALRGHNRSGMRPLRPVAGSRAWMLLVLLALAPMWLIGTLDRGLWTPDEPREADIAWRMSVQRNWVLPQLAGSPFLEKPPLSYWMSAESSRLLGPSVDAARAPNLLYAAVTALAVAGLGYVMDGVVAAIVAALVAGTAITAFRVTVWLAPDACLLAGCAVSLLGAYLGYIAPRGRKKLCGYLLMHAGAAVGFMAKSAPGWLVPALALLTLVAWERRWSELRRPELYAGLLLQALVIGPWIQAVARTPHGGESLRVLFWYNLAGRFTRIAAPARYEYSAGHRNSLGEYFLELPVYLLPWTALAAAAAWRARQQARLPGPAGTRWRFAVAAALPFLLLLSLAATARDIYAAPALLGFGLLIALWLSESQRLTPVAGGAMRWTRWLIAAIACVFSATLAALAVGAVEAAHGETDSAITVGKYIGAAAVMLTSVAIALRVAARAQRRGHLLRSFGWAYAAYAAGFCITAVAIFPAIDRWHDLPVLARQIHLDAEHTSLALLNPDETTVAMLDRRLRTRFTVLVTEPHSAPGAVSAWFIAHGSRARVLVLLPGHAPGELTPLLARMHLGDHPGDGIAGELETQGVAAIVHRYQLPHGRRYALLAPSAERPNLTATRSRPRARALGRQHPKDEQTGDWAVRSAGACPAKV